MPHLLKSPHLTSHNDGSLCLQKSVASYGCFVDFGSTTDGLVHISQLSHGYVKDINSFVKPGQKVTVTVLSVDDGKVALSMKGAENEGVDLLHELDIAAGSMGGAPVTVDELGLEC